MRHGVSLAYRLECLCGHGCCCSEPSDVRHVLPRCLEPCECKKVLCRIGSVLSTVSRRIGLCYQVCFAGWALCYQVCLVGWALRYQVCFVG